MVVFVFDILIKIDLFLDILTKYLGGNRKERNGKERRVYGICSELPKRVRNININF